jgi:hypothetical protein
MKRFQSVVHIAAVTLFVLARPAWAQTDWSALHFHGGDARWFTADGDWAPKNWKGECGITNIGIADTVMIGVSSSPGNGSCGLFGCTDEWTDSILCATPPTTVVQTSTLSTMPYTGLSYLLDFGAQDDRFDTSWGDWAYGLFKGECAPTDGITGLAETQNSGNIGSTTWKALCSPMPGNLEAQDCAAMNFTNGDAREQGSVGGDWDYGFHKGQCGPGRYVKGVAVRSDDGCAVAGCPGTSVKAILCCSPTF